MGWLCDGQKDCPDADDEEGCPTKLQSFFNRLKEHINVEAENETDETTTTVATSTTTTITTSSEVHLEVHFYSLIEFMELMNNLDNEISKWNSRRCNDKFTKNRKSLSNNLGRPRI